MSYTDDMMPSDDEDRDDAYMRQMKAEGKERDEEIGMDDDDDEDESGVFTVICACSFERQNISANSARPLDFLILCLMAGEPNDSN